MVQREYGCIFEHDPLRPFRWNVQRALATMRELPHAYRRMFAEYAYGEYAPLYDNNADGLLLNFLGNELANEEAIPGFNLVGDHLEWENQYEALVERAAPGAGFDFSSNLCVEFQGDDLWVSGRGTSVRWFSDHVWPLLVRRSDAPSARGERESS